MLIRCPQGIATLALLGAALISWGLSSRTEDGRRHRLRRKSGLQGVSVED